MTAAFTASAIERVVECPASAVLPHTLDDSDDGMRGTAIHAYVERRLSGMTNELALGLVPEPSWRTTCDGIDLRSLLSGVSDVRPEQTYAIDVFGDASFDIGTRRQRRYPEDLPPHVIFGTTDVRGIRLDGMPMVRDLKTGFKEVTRARDNLQIKFAARAEQQLTGADVVDGGIWYIRPNGYVVSDSHEFTRFDLDGFPDLVADAVREVEVAREIVEGGGVPDVVAGEWCRYCPAMPSCPKHVGLVRAALGQLLELNVEGKIAALTPAEAGRAWLVVKQIEHLAERISTALNAYADRVPLPTRPGKVVRAIGIRKSYFRKGRAIHLLVKKGATQDEIEACFDPVVETQHRECKER